MEHFGRAESKKQQQTEEQSKYERDQTTALSLKIKTKCNAGNRQQGLCHTQLILPI